MRRNQGSTKPKPEPTAQTNEVFDRLFNTAGKQKARLTLKVKESHSKKANPPKTDKKPQSSTQNLLRENKGLANKAKRDSRTSSAKQTKGKALIVDPLPPFDYVSVS